MNSSNVAAQRGRPSWGLIAPVGIMLLVLATYWPVVHAGFVWDDVVDFVDMPWLREGDHWQHFIFKQFNDWQYYFRPLVVGLFTLEVRAFNVAPGPMHAVSLAIHLVNTLLVGWLASVVARKRLPDKRHWVFPSLAMLVFGLHPVLIEPISWIGCQFELVATLMMLLGVIGNVTIRRSIPRALIVSLCFLFALFSKESAICLPALIALFDLLDTTTYPGEFVPALRAILKRNWATYAALVPAVLGYLVIRHWALGSLVPSMHPPGPLFARIHEVAFVYLRYWRFLLVPMQGMSPIHPWPTGDFGDINAASAGAVVLAVAIFSLGVFLCLRRSAFGGVLMAITIGLLPVLHIVPAGFDTSPYHERYVMTGLAFACALLPVVLATLRWQAMPSRLTGVAGIAILLAWTGSSIAGIRTTVPLWYSNVTLWRWALTVDPNSVPAKDSLISAYIERNDFAHAWQVFQQLGPDKRVCDNCMLNMAAAAISANRLDLAKDLLDDVQASRQLQFNHTMFRAYLTTRAKLLTVQGDYAGAESLFRVAIQQDALDPAPQIALATVLLLQGNVGAAIEQDQRATALLSPGDREAHQQAFRALLERARAGTLDSTPAPPRVE